MKKQPVIDSAEAIVNKLGGNHNYGFIVKNTLINRYGMVKNFHQQNDCLRYSLDIVSESSDELYQTAWALKNVEIVTPINLNNRNQGERVDRLFIHTLLSQYNKSLSTEG